MRGVAYALGARESEELKAQARPCPGFEKTEVLPSYEDVRSDKLAFAEATLHDGAGQLCATATSTLLVFDIEHENQLSTASDQAPATQRRPV